MPRFVSCTLAIPHAAVILSAAPRSPVLDDRDRRGVEVSRPLPCCCRESLDAVWEEGLQLHSSGKHGRDPSTTLRMKAGNGCHATNLRICHLPAAFYIFLQIQLASLQLRPSRGVGFWLK